MTPDSVTLAIVLVAPFIFNAVYAVRVSLR